MIKVYTSLR